AARIRRVGSVGAICRAARVGVVRAGGRLAVHCGAHRPAGGPRRTTDPLRLRFAGRTRRRTAPARVQHKALLPPARHGPSADCRGLTTSAVSPLSPRRKRGHPARAMKIDVDLDAFRFTGKGSADLRKRPTELKKRLAEDSGTRDKAMAEFREEIDDLQQMMYADDRSSLL